MERTAEMKIIILLHTFPITHLLIADFVSRTLKRIRIRKQNVTVTTEITSQIQKPIRSSLVLNQRTPHLQISFSTLPNWWEYVNLSIGGLLLINIEICPVLLRSCRVVWNSNASPQGLSNKYFDGHSNYYYTIWAMTMGSSIISLWSLTAHEEMNSIYTADNGDHK